MKRYTVWPGYVRSASDGDRHYVGFLSLCRLYGVNPAECINVDGLRNVLGYSREFLDSLPQLRVRTDGDYRRPE